MFLTIEELIAFKEKYEEEIKELSRKKEVVEDLIQFAKAKEVQKTQEESFHETYEEKYDDTEE